MGDSFGGGEGKTLQPGSDGWWAGVAVTEASIKLTKEIGLTSKTTLKVKEKKMVRYANDFIDSINRNPFKQLWFRLTSGKITIYEGDKMVEVMKKTKKGGKI